MEARRNDELCSDSTELNQDILASLKEQLGTEKNNVFKLGNFTAEETQEIATHPHM